MTTFGELYYEMGEIFDRGGFVNLADDAWEDTARGTLLGYSYGAVILRGPDETFGLNAHKDLREKLADVEIGSQVEITIIGKTRRRYEYTVTVLAPVHA